MTNWTLFFFLKIIKSWGTCLRKGEKMAGRQKVLINEESQLSSLQTHAVTTACCASPKGAQAGQESKTNSSFCCWRIVGENEMWAGIHRGLLEICFGRPDQPVQVCFLVLCLVVIQEGRQHSSSSSSDNFFKFTAWWIQAVGPSGVGPSEAKQGGTERGSCWGSQRGCWGRVALFGEEWVGIEMLGTRREAVAQRLEVDLELVLAGMEVAVASFWAERGGKRSCCQPRWGEKQLRRFPESGREGLTAGAAAGPSSPSPAASRF